MRAGARGVIIWGGFRDATVLRKKDPDIFDEDTGTWDPDAADQDRVQTPCQTRLKPSRYAPGKGNRLCSVRLSFRTREISARPRDMRAFFDQKQSLTDRGTPPG